MFWCLLGVEKGMERKMMNKVGPSVDTAKRRFTLKENDVVDDSQRL